MNVKSMIEHIKQQAGMTESEARDALEMMVESLAVHLPERERAEFASGLPEQLQDIALSVMATEENSRMDMVRQFMQMEHISRARARRQIVAAWHALKRAVDITKLERVKLFLPRQSVAYLR